jgi:hypothetical protein
MTFGLTVLVNELVQAATHNNRCRGGCLQEKEIEKAKSIAAALSRILQ